MSFLGSLVEKLFGTTTLDNRLKALTLLVLIISYRNNTDASRWTVRNMMVDFCFLLGWTRSQIDYSPQTQIEAFEFSDRLGCGWKWNIDYHNLMLSCLNLLLSC